MKPTFLRGDKHGQLILTHQEKQLQNEQKSQAVFRAVSDSAYVDLEGGVCVCVYTFCQTDRKREVVEEVEIYTGTEMGECRLAPPHSSRTLTIALHRSW